ncbi:MAG: hypothetical protein AABW83_00540 [Nanoarchaeota archaeon]
MIEINKSSSWKDCLENWDSIKITSDMEKAKSLIETAKGRIEINKDLNDKTANYIFEDYYSSILELIHAIILLDGYKVMNHVCIGFYLRDMMKRDDLFRIFDDCRYKRNSLVYYGKRMEFKTAVDAIKKAKKLFNELIILLKF